MLFICKDALGTPGPALPLACSQESTVNPKYGSPETWPLAALCHAGPRSPKELLLSPTPTRPLSRVWVCLHLLYSCMQRAIWAPTALHQQGHVYL